MDWLWWAPDGGDDFVRSFKEGYSLAIEAPDG